MATAIKRSSVSSARAPALLGLLVLFFFLSGLCGLVYQVLWSRLLALVFGITVYAVSATLASFMSGLALGSYIAGKLVDRARSPLLWYGVAEVLIGLSALATPWALDGMERLYAGLYPSLSASFGALTIVRFALSFLVLLVPTTLMGATLPIVIKSSLLRSERLAESIGLLYATNTAGAILGTLLTGYYLIGEIGILATFRLAAAINVAVGIAAGLTAAKFKPSATAAASTPSPPAAAAVAAPLSARSRRRILFVFMLSGFISFALEVVWFRVLSISLGGSIYAFVVMLAAFLSGISLGSYAVAPFMRRRWNWLVILAYVEMLMAVVSLLSLTLMAKIYPLLAAQGQWTRAAGFIAILPATLLMGAAFPVGLHLYSASEASAGPRQASGVGSEIGKRVGVFYALNLFGSIAGAIAGGFLLLPVLGSRNSFLVLAGLTLGGGLLLLASLPPSGRRRHGLSVAVAVGLFALAAFSLPRLSEMILTEQHRGATLLHQEEGVQTTATIQRSAEGQTVMYLDAHHQAEDSASIVGGHRRIAHLAMTLHNDPKDVLVIGLGGGVTAGAASLHEGATIDVVELSDTVVRASDWFRHVNHDVMNRPNVRLRIDDGRNYLRLTDRRYDVLTADIIHPTQAGSGNLYSAEYFRLCANALKDDGLMLQWISQRSQEEYELIMRTFVAVFPHATLWADGALIVGTKKPLEIERDAFERRMREPATRAALEQFGIKDFPSLLALFRAGAEEMREFLGPGDLILTDDRPLTEYYLSLKNDGSPFDISRLSRGDVSRHVR